MLQHVAVVGGGGVGDGGGAAAIVSADVGLLLLTRCEPPRAIVLGILPTFNHGTASVELANFPSNYAMARVPFETLCRASAGHPLDKTHTNLKNAHTIGARFNL